MRCVYLARIQGLLGWKASPLTRADLLSNLVNMLWSDPRSWVEVTAGPLFVNLFQLSVGLRST